MRSISTEGIGASMVYDRRVAVILFAVLIAASLLDSLSITSLAISDSDFTTYIIVPMLMLPLFALFMLKERIEPHVGRRDVAVGIVIFAVLALLTVFLRAQLSYLFSDLHVEMLLFPLLLLSLAALLFGIRNLNRFKAIAIYSLFASPALLLWMASLNSAFVVANTLAIYGALSLFFHNAAYIAPLTITANGYSVGIGETCVGIGILIGTVLFLAPLAYLYDGKLSSKALWVASGFGLMLLLNLLRMLGIAFAWFFYGPSNAILTVHLFAGILLFYIAIVVMILLSGRYGLRMPLPVRRKEKRARPGAAARSNGTRFYLAGIAAAVAVTAVYLLLLSDYPGVQVVSPLVVYDRVGFNASGLDGLVNTISNESSFNVSIFQDTQDEYILMTFSNATFNQSAPIEVLLLSSRIDELRALTNNTTVTGELTFFSTSGLTQRVYSLSSDGYGFLLYNEVEPYAFANGSSTSVAIYAVLPENRTSSGITCQGYYNAPYTEMINAPDPRSYNSTADAEMTSAYCIIERMVG